MSYSNKNQSFDQMLKGKYDQNAQDEVVLALEIRKKNPKLTYGQALKQASDLLACSVLSRRS